MGEEVEQGEGLFGDRRGRHGFEEKDMGFIGF